MAGEPTPTSPINNYENNVATAVKANPTLASDPSTLHAIGSASGADAHGLAMLTNYNNLVSNVKTSIYDEANSSKNSGNWWHDLTNVADGAVQTVGEVGKSVGGALQRTATTVGEVGTLGLVGFKNGKATFANNFGDAAANIGDAFTTVKNLGKGVMDAVPNPQNNFGLTQASQLVSFFSSDAARHGVAHAIGRALPYILASRFGAESLVGAGAEAVDAANLVKIEARVAAGNATDDDLARAMAIRQRQVRSQFAETAQADAKAADEARMAGAPKSFKNPAKVFQGTSKWVPGVGLKALKGVDALNRSMQLQALYYMVGASVQSDPNAKALWDSVADGHPVDAFGRKQLISAGQSFAQSFGIEPGTAPYSLVSGTIDFGTKISSDPFTAGFGVLEKANTAEGLGGLLGNWWKGLGVETGADVARVAGTTASSARAIKFIAESDAIAIRKFLRRDLVGPSEVVDRFINRLADAKTPAKVIEVFADVADGQYFTRNVLPTRKAWRTIGTALKDFATLSGAQRALKKEGIDIATRSAMEAAEKSISSKVALWVRRKAASNLTEAPWYTEAGAAAKGMPNIKNYSFRMGDKNAIPALQAMMQMSGEFSRTEIDAMGDALNNTPNPQDFAHALNNVTATMLDQAIAKATDSPAYNAVHVELRKTINELVQQLYDAGGGGRPGIYVNGELGDIYSLKAPLEDRTNTGFFGHADTHISQGKFIDPQILAGVVRKMSALVKNLGPQVVGEGNRLRYLNEEAYAAMANYRKARLFGIEKAVSSTATRSIRGFMGSRFANERVYGYKNAQSVYTDIFARVRTMPGVNDFEKFVMGSRQVFQETDKVTSELAKLRATPGASARQIAELEGRLTAFEDIERHLFTRVQSLPVTMTDLNDFVDFFGINIDKKLALQKSVQEAIDAQLEKQLRRTGGSYLHWGNLLVDGANRLLSHVLIPLMLSTGGYIERIAGAEFIPNLLRFGSTDFIEASLTRSIGKRMLKYAPLQEGIVKTAEGIKKVPEASVIKRLVLDSAELLHNGGKFAERFFAGALTGTQRGILEAMSGDRFYRMLDDFQTVLQLTGGAVPDIGHSSAQLYNSDSISGASAEMTYGVDTKGNVATSKTYASDKFARANGENIVTALGNNMRKVHVDQKLRAVAEDLRKITSVRGSIFTNDERKQILNDLKNLDLPRKQALSDSELAPFVASNRVIASLEYTTGSPMEDWSLATAYDVLSIFSGVNKEGKWVIHNDLLDQAITGEIKGPAALAKQYASLDGAPKNLIDRQPVKFPWQTKGVREFNKLMEAVMRIPGAKLIGAGASTLLKVPNAANHYILDKTFGRLLGWVSREPTFLLGFHIEMEALRDKVARGIITEDQAINKSMENSFLQMAKYVHNPADRFAFEQNARMYSPFWFAKNQAYRRAFRMLEENPQAFTEFLKFSLHATDYLHSHSQNGQSPVIAIPFTEYLPGFMSNIFNFGPTIGGMMFDYSGSLSSLNSVILTGYQTGLAGLEEMIRPPAGPFVSVAEKLIGETGLFDPKSYNKFLEATLGPVGSKTNVFSDLVPSAFYRDLFQEAVMSPLGANPAPIMQAQIKAMHSKNDDFRAQLVAEYYKKYGKNKFASAEQEHLDANLYADEMYMQYFGNPTTGYQHQQKFMDEMHIAALGLYMGKLVTMFALPVSTSLQERFSKSPEFNKILKQKLPDGSPIGFSSAISEFALKYPQNYIDTVSTSQSPYGAFGQTADFMKWQENAPNLIKENGIPFLAALLIDNTGQPAPAAYQSQVSMQLRKADTPQQYMDATLISMGDQWYYEYLEPTYYKAYGTYVGPNDPGNNISYQGKQLLDAATKDFVKNVNPTWGRYASPLVASTSKEHEIAAVTQLGAFVGDPKMQQETISKGLLSKEDVNNINEAYKIYNAYIAEINATSGTAKYNLKQSLYSTMEQAAKQPGATKLVRLLNTLAKAPTAN
jgi:hypothetical protein